MTGLAAPPWLRAARAAPPDDGVRVSRLANGMTVVSHALPHLQTVALGVWVGAGSRDETPDQAGVAHFLEHMAFKGTRKRDAFQIAAVIEDRGGDLNAATTPEHTGYTAHVLKDDWRVALEVIADIVCDPLFDEMEMERERGVILQEIAALADDPAERAFERAEAIAWREHALGRPVAGLPQVVRGLCPADLAAFRATHHVATRMVVAAAGAVDHDALSRAVEALFADLPRGAPRVASPPVFRTGSDDLAHGQEQAHVVLAWPFFSLREEELWAGQALAAILGGGMSSRLFQELRERRGLCYAVQAWPSVFEDAGMLFFHAATAPGEARHARALMLRVAREVCAGIDASELSRARAQARAALVMSLESAPARAAQMARQCMAWGMVPSIATLQRRIADIDENEVIAAARRVFSAEPVSVLAMPRATGVKGERA